MAVVRPIVFFISCSLLAFCANAQTHAGDRSSTQGAKPNFSGEWTLNRELSDDTATSDEGRGDDYHRAGGRRGGGFGGFGGGGGRGGFGHRGPYPPSPGAPDDRAKAQDAIRDARSPSPSLTISHSAVNIAITDARGRTRFFQTTGALDKHQFASGTVDSTTSWNADQLVVQYDLGNGRRLTYAYALTSAGRQLVVRVRVDGGASYGLSGSRTIKYVYDAARTR
jgi:hypothetical protein